MADKSINFDISDDVLALGVRGIYFNMDNIRNKVTDSGFEDLKNRTLKSILTDLSNEKIEESPILEGFRQLHRAVGSAGKKNISSPENLAGYVLRTKQLPHINLLVDIYNLISLKTFLAIGAHDLARVSGNIHLRLTDGTENFHPLGSEQLKSVKANEYAYTDDNNDILCRLETRQVEKTKITEDSTECFFIVQGSDATNASYLHQAADELIATTKRFCGGRENILYSP